MKRFLMITSCLGFLAAPLVGHGADDARVSINVDAEHDTFTGLFRSVWARLNSISPRDRERPAAAPVPVAGIRGQGSSSIMNLYWKDDLNDDRQFQAELADYATARRSLNRGDLEIASDAFAVFLARYPGSSLRPNALLGRGVGLAGAGRGEQSIATLQQFVDENPGHPLTRDVRQLIGLLHSEGFVAAAQ